MAELESVGKDYAQLKSSGDRLSLPGSMNNTPVVSSLFKPPKKLDPKDSKQEAPLEKNN